MLLFLFAIILVRDRARAQAHAPLHGGVPHQPGAPLHARPRPRQRRPHAQVAHRVRLRAQRHHRTHPQVPVRSLAGQGRGR